MKRWLRLIVCVIAASACGGSDPSGPAVPAPAGNWTLHTIDGRVVPTTEIGYVVVSDFLTIRAGGSFTGTQTYRDLNGQNPQTFSGEGTWSLSGQQITLEAPGSRSRSTGLFSSNTITIDWGDRGYTYVYARQ